RRQPLQRAAEVRGSHGYGGTAGRGPSRDYPQRRTDHRRAPCRAQAWHVHDRQGPPRGTVEARGPADTDPATELADELRPRSRRHPADPVREGGGIMSVPMEAKAATGLEQLGLK